MRKSLLKKTLSFIVQSYKGRPNKKQHTPALPHDFIKHKRTRAFWNSVEPLVNVLEARDAYTAFHSKHVALMSIRFCIVKNLTLPETERTLLAAITHDLGKIGISDAALKKAGPLTETEWNEIKCHPAIGADLIQRAYGLDEISGIIRHHHERWDGKGYPDGLSEQGIPLSSRIIALCDSVDAMLTRRIYRNELSTEVCMSELRKNCGVMYDPDLTELFLNNWDYITSVIHDEVLSQNT